MSLSLKTLPSELANIVVGYFYQICSSEVLAPTLLILKRLRAHSYSALRPLAMNPHASKFQTEWLIDDESVFPASAITWYNERGEICGSFAEHAMLMHPRMTCFDTGVCLHAILDVDARW